jgi:hypothetical protein
VSFTITVTDDTPVDCSEVTVAYVLGRNEHGHPLSSTAGRTGTITTFVDSGHAGAENLRGSRTSWQPVAQYGRSRA